MCSINLLSHLVKYPDDVDRYRCLRLNNEASLERTVIQKFWLPRNDEIPLSVRTRNSNSSLLRCRLWFSSKGRKSLRFSSKNRKSLWLVRKIEKVLHLVLKVEKVSSKERKVFDSILKIEKVYDLVRKIEKCSKTEAKIFFIKMFKSMHLSRLFSVLQNKNTKLIDCIYLNYESPLIISRSCLFDEFTIS